MAILDLLRQLKIQAVLMEDVKSDSCTMSFLGTRAASERLNIMTVKQYLLQDWDSASAGWPR